MKMFEVMKKEAVLDVLKEHFNDHVMDTETISILDATGRVLAQSVISQENIPDFVRSTVDGYAVFSENTVGVTESMPAFLNLVGEVKMGELCTHHLNDYETVYVPTGGSIPIGADAVVMIEHTDDFGQEIAINKSVARLENIVGIGDDVSINEIVLEKGTQISPQHIGALAALGVHRVEVTVKPKLTIISTGDELVDIHEPLALGKIRDVNAYTLKILAEKAGLEVIRTQRIPDIEASIRSALDQAVSESDFVFLSGGSSVGNHDMTSDVINMAGSPGVLVHGVAIKPGKPTIIGKVGSSAVFGLPGHPASCVIAFKAVVEPFIDQVILKKKKLEPQIHAKCGFDMHVSSGRDVYFMVKLDRGTNPWTAHPVQGKSGMVSLFSKADGYIEIPMEKEGLRTGDVVSVKLFE